MQTTDKETEAYWFGKLCSPFPQVNLPWQSAQGSQESMRYSVSAEVPVATVAVLKEIANNNDTAVTLLFISALKLLLFRYTQEKNVQINILVNDGLIPLTVESNRNMVLKELITAVSQEYVNGRTRIVKDAASLTEKYRIRFQQDISHAFYNVAFSDNESDHHHHFVCIVKKEGEGYNIKFDYQSDYNFSSDFLQLMLQNFLFIIAHLKENLTRSLEEIDVRSEKDKQIDGNSMSATDTITGDALHKIIEGHAATAPLSTAIVSGNQSITYGELNRKANQLAHLLRERGVARATIVGILYNRGIDIIIGILAILKAGGIYMPIDPKYPEERKRYMLTDSGAELLLTDACFTSDDISVQPESNLDINDDSTPAYIIYTSGTTGKPKGVVVTHRNVTNLFYSQNHFNFDNTYTWSLFHSFCFDFSVWEMYGALLYGGRLIIIPESDIIDPARVLSLLVQEKVNVLCQTPTFFYNLMQEALTGKEALNLAYVIFGGEALNLSRLKDWMTRFPDTKMINMYGITETTIHTTYKHVTLDDTDSDISNIGVSLPHLSIYLLDDALREVPVGATGEIFVGGTGVAGGYLNRVVLTAERFRTLPYHTAAGIVYRSGDLARRMPDGDIEYIGRKDNQVKINGFRIELEEVESQLLNTGLVQDAVVIVRQYNGSKVLCAFYVADAAVTVDTMKETLSATLPHYMVPGLFMRMDKLPVTINGKKNKALLPDINPVEERIIIPPVTGNEKILANAWSRIFGMKDVSIDDEFYALGGDSIKAIQLKAALTSQGYSVEIANILRLHRLQDIAAGIVRLAIHADQGPVSGDIMLHPVQERLLAQNADAYDHFNQSVLLNIHNKTAIAELPGIFEELIRHHDALRTRLTTLSDGKITAAITAPQQVSFETYNGLSSAEMQDKIIALQRSMRLMHAPLIKAILFITAADCRLFICVHHFVIDGVSWRILLEDLYTLYAQRCEGKIMQLPAKTHSAKYWNKHLYEIAQAPAVIKESAYWTNICKAAGKNIYSDSGEYYESDFSVVNIPIEVRDVLRTANKAYNTSVEELLMTALYLTLMERYPASGLTINLERHGRNGYSSELDTGRTIGWFTNVFPFRIDGLHIHDTRAAIIAVKDQLRGVPGHGQGYGILRYLSASGAALDYRPDVEFNYLGQFSTDADNSLFSVLSYTEGELRGGDYKHQSPVIVNALTDAAGMLRMEMMFNRNVLDEAAGSELASSFGKHLHAVTTHCLNKQLREYTLTDFMVKGISLPILNELAATFDVEDIYPLTPVQEGILFHHLLNRDANVYSEQIVYTFNGPLNIDVFYESLDQLSKRHVLLRTVYIYHQIERPVQVVLRNGAMGRQFEDISDHSAAEKQLYISAVKEADKKTGVSLDTGPLIRLHILKLTDNKYCLIWYFHHLIMDGWCLDIVNNELFGIYGSLSAGKTPALLPAPDYSGFIRWLAEGDMDMAKHYWKDFLKDYTSRPLIPLLRPAEGKAASFLSITAVIPDHVESALRKLAKEHHLSMNSLLQLAWALLLGRYNNTHDVVFGLVVSGRPAEIKDIDRMIGMFINTIPQRLLLDDTSDLIALADGLQKRALSSVAYQHYPLADIQKNNGAHGELFDHIMNYINYPLADRLQLFAGEDISLKGLIDDVQVSEQTHYDFSLSIVDGRSITIKFDYNENRYNSDIIGHMFDAYQYIIAQIASGIRDINNIEVLTPAYKSSLMQDVSPVLMPPVIQDLFTEQVIRSPFHPALADGTAVLSYTQLNEAAEHLCSQLKQAGVLPDTVIGLFADRSVGTIIGILGILKAGCIYLPVEADYPSSRIQYLLDDAGVGCIVVTGETWELLRENGLDTDSWTMSESAEGALSIFIRHINNPVLYEPGLAYILYTSGSTGLPKGVPVKQTSLVNYITWQMNCLDVRQEDCVLQFSSLCFDTSVEEIFIALCSGAQLVLVKKDVLLDGSQFIRFTDKHKISVIHSVPSFIATLDPDSLKYLRILVTGGDTCPVQVAEKWCKKVAFYNSYGPTETTVTATQQLVPGQSSYTYSLPIGRPAADAEIYILDKMLRLLPPGVSGEIFIGGAGVSSGYVNRPELTKERFIDNHLTGRGRLYRTGDLGRWLPDGTVEFLGRTDRQVKIRGHRIELGEIEFHISNFCDNAQVVVQPVEKAGGQTTLIACCQTDKEVDKKALRKFLQQYLPDYMIPSGFYIVDEIPLTYNGKVDVNALKQLAAHNSGSEQHFTDLNNTQSRLVEIWREVLGVQTVGIDDNFFELGGTSIDMIVVSSRLKTHFGLDDMLVKMFHHSTINSLASFIDNSIPEVAEAVADNRNDELRERRKRKRDLRN